MATYPKGVPKHAEFLLKFTSAEALDDIVAIGPTNTTEKTIAVSLPDGARIVRAMLAAFITIMNDSANAQKINVDVQGRISGGAWSTFFSQDAFIGVPAVDAASTGMVALQDVSGLVNAAGTFGFRLSVVQTSANSVHFLSQFMLILTYRMS